MMSNLVMKTGLRAAWARWGWHGTAIALVPPPVTAADGERALGFIPVSLGKETEQPSKTYMATDWTIPLKMPCAVKMLRGKTLTCLRRQSFLRTLSLPVRLVAQHYELIQIMNKFVFYFTCINTCSGNAILLEWTRALKAGWINVIHIKNAAGHNLKGNKAEFRSAYISTSGAKPFAETSSLLY